MITSVLSRVDVGSVLLLCFFSLLLFDPSVILIPSFGDAYNETYTQHVVNNSKLPLDNVKINVLNSSNSDPGHNVPGIYNVSYIADFTGFNSQQFVLLRVQATASTLQYLTDNISKYNDFASTGGFSNPASTQYAVTIEQQSN